MLTPPAGPFGRVYLPAPVDKDHPDNQGLVSWLLALKSLANGPTWYDLVGYSNGTFTSLGASEGWGVNAGMVPNEAVVTVNGNGHFVNWGAPTAFATTGSLTLTGWFYRTGGGGGFPRLFSKLTGVPYNGYEVALNSSVDFTPYFEVGNAGTLVNTTTTGSPCASNAWTHVAAVADSAAGTIQAYVNGVITGGAVAATFTNGSVNLQLGEWPGGNGNFFQGFFNDIAFWNRALSQDRIRRLYWNSLAGWPGRLRRVTNKYISVGVPQPVPEVHKGPPMFGAPWATFQLETLPSAAPVTLPPPPAAPIPEINTGPPMQGAPWFKVPIPHPPAAAAAPFVQPAPPSLGEVHESPPMPWAPYFLLTPFQASVNAPAPPPALAGIVAPVPEVHAGPIPGSPFFQVTVLPPSAPPVPPQPPSPTRPSPVKSFLPRVPDIDTIVGKDRLTRFTQIMSAVINSILGRNQLQQVGQESWILNPTSVQSRAPGATDDLTQGFRPGSLWLDQSASGVYMCMSATVASAVWKKIA